jgi:thiosulfate reductase cytochrome b subunit
MAHLKLVLVLALASQNGIAMQTDSTLPSPTVLRVVGVQQLLLWEHFIMEQS